MVRHLHGHPGLVEARNVLNRSREELAREVEARTRELDRIWSISEDLFVVATASSPAAT